MTAFVIQNREHSCVISNRMKGNPRKREMKRKQIIEENDNVKGFLKMKKEERGEK